MQKAAKTFVIDEPIVNIGLNNAPTHHHPTLKNGLVQAANNFAAGDVLPEGFNCLLVIPQWDTDYTVEVIERHGDEDRFIGAYGWFGPFNLFGKQRYGKVLKALVEHDLPLVFHNSLSFWHQNTPVGDGVLSCTRMLGFDWPIFVWITTVNFIMSGSSEKHPA